MAPSVLFTLTGIQRLPDQVDRSSRTGVLRLLFVGRLVRTKGARDAIRAVSLLTDLPVTLEQALYLVRSTLLTSLHEWAG